VPIASIKIKLRILPTPKYNNIRNKDNEEAVISPRRELAKIKEKVKRRATKIVIKNKRITPNVPGSTK
jgi:hypothetical protein